MGAGGSRRILGLPGRMVENYFHIYRQYTLCNTGRRICCISVGSGRCRGVCHQGVDDNCLHIYQRERCERCGDSEHDTFHTGNGRFRDGRCVRFHELGRRDRYFIPDNGLRGKWYRRLVLLHCRRHLHRDVDVFGI